jgi:hypothetical protein
MLCSGKVRLVYAYLPDQACTPATLRRPVQKGVYAGQSPLTGFSLSGRRKHSYVTVVVYPFSKVLHK